MKSTLMVATILAVAILLFAGEAPDEAAPSMTPTTPIYMVEYDAGPSYLPGMPFAEQPGFMEHGAYMDQLHDAGILVFGGPFLDDLDSLVVTGATLVLKVGSETEAREVVDRDPAVSHRLLTIVEIRAFMAMIDCD